MKKIAFILGVVCFLYFSAPGEEKPFLEGFSLKTGKLHLSRAVQPRAYFDAVGQKSAVLGLESGTAEVWIYPYKVLSNLQLYFLMEDENEIIIGKDVANRIDVYPHQTVIRYVHSSFQVEEVFFTPLKEGGVAVLLSVNSIKPLSVIASFTPDLKPMWPAGLGGQYSYWDGENKYFVLSEGTRRNVALVGSPEGERFSSGPAHALPEGDMKIKINIDPEMSKETFFPIFISASHTGRKLADDIYARMGRDFEKLYLEKFNHMNRLLHEHLSVRTPNDLLNQAFQWAKVAVDNAFVCNPQLGCGLVAGYGLSRRSERPGFAWYFGGDTFFNSWAINSYGSFDVTRQSLALIRKNQRDDGKIMHELSQGAGFIQWFDQYPYGYYHAETSPYYIVALHDYLISSGDVKFIQESWPSIKKAYQYVLNADTDGDGLMENAVAGLAALELGAFLKNTKSDIYLAALSVECHRVFSELALLMKDRTLSGGAENTFNKALKALRERFWEEKKQRYAHAITVDGEPLMETTVWPSMPLFFRHLPRVRADHILDILASAEMSTDWGVRSLSPQSSYYDPQNYNYGTVWPFLTGYSCLAEYNYGRSLSGFSHLMNLAHNSFIDALGNCSELFSGEFFTPLETSVPHQVFSSSPVVTCLVRGLFGLKGNALAREIEFSPSFPGSWKDADIRNFKIGEDLFHFTMQRAESRFMIHIDSQTKETYLLHLSPSVGYGARVNSVRVNGKEVEFQTDENYGDVRCAVTLEMTGKTEVEILTEGGILLDLPPHFPRIGDKTTHLKIIQTLFKNNEMRILVEGLGTKTYMLNIFTERPIVSTSEAEVEDTEEHMKKVKIHFEGSKDIYSRKEVIIRFD